MRIGRFVPAFLGLLFAPAFAGGAPLAPYNFSAVLQTHLGMPVAANEAQADRLKVRLSWVFAELGAGEVQIEQNADDDTWRRLPETALVDAKHAEVACMHWRSPEAGDACIAAPGGVISFRIRTLGEQGASDFVYTSVHIPARPAPVSGLEAAVIYGVQNGIRLNWIDNAVNEAGYHVHWRKKGREYGQTLVLPANAKDYDILAQNIEPDTTYVIEVRPHNVFYAPEDVAEFIEITTPGMSLDLVEPEDGRTYKREVPVTVRSAFLASDPYVLFDWWWLPPEGGTPVPRDVMSTIKVEAATGDTQAAIPVERFEQPGTWRLRMRYIKTGGNIVVDREIVVKK